LLIGWQGNLIKKKAGYSALLPTRILPEWLVELDLDQMGWSGLAAACLLLEHTLADTLSEIWYQGAAFCGCGVVHFGS
jgi:hypothetical protein